MLKDGTHGTHIDVDDGGVYLLSAKNIKYGKVCIDSSDRRISEDEYNHIHKNYSLHKGDVLLTIVGSIGETAIIENSTKMTFQRSVAFLRPSEKIDSQFLFSLINTPYFQKQLQSKQVTSAQPGIYLGQLENIPIKFPIISEQQKIGVYFRQLDELIAQHGTLVQKLKQIKTACLEKMFV